MIQVTNKHSLNFQLIRPYTKFKNITKRHVGEIVPKLSTASKNILNITGKHFLFVNNPGGVLNTTFRRVTVCTRLLSPYKIQTTKHHRKELIRNVTMSTQNKTQLAFCFENLIGTPKTITLTTAENVTYTTVINHDTTINDLTTEKLLEELRSRKLIIEDKNNVGSTSISLKNDTTAVVGLSKNEVKLTPLGQAYVESILKKDIKIQEQTMPCPEMIHNNFFISIPPSSTDDTIIDYGKQKHLLFIHNDESEYCMAIGYLTSKKSANILNDKQFKSFQEEQNGIINSSTKVQYIVLFDRPLKMKKSDIQEAKWDQEYIQNIPYNYKKKLISQIEIKWTEGYSDFTYGAITKQDALQMCKDFDKVVSTKGKHPLTALQVKLNEDNKAKQKEQHKNKPKMETTE